MNNIIRPMVITILGAAVILGSGYVYTKKELSSYDKKIASVEKQTAELDKKYEANIKAKEQADTDAVNDVIGKIDAIGEVTLESTDAINTAQSSYDSLSDELKAEVTNKAN